MRPNEMHNDAAVPFAQGTVRFLNASDVRRLDAWNNAFQDKCKDRRYYELIEETLANDFEYRYAVLQDTAGNVRAIQSIFFSGRICWRGWAENSASWSILLAKYFRVF